MKRKIYAIMLLCFGLFSFPCSGKGDCPEEVKVVFDKLKIKEKNNLTNFRHGYRNNFSFELMCWFRDHRLLEKAKKCNLSIDILYDEPMRKRIIQLMSGEISSYEMDSIVARCSRYSNDYLKEKAFFMAKIDTLSIYKIALKELYANLKKEDKFDIDKVYSKAYQMELFWQMELDTLNVYKHIYYNLLETRIKECENETIDYFSNRFDCSSLAELCGYLKDKRFKKLLIAALDKPRMFNKEIVVEALVRMKVEPYYTQYIKERTRTLDEIKQERPNFRIEKFVNVVRTQESFREISKYLLSDVPYRIQMEDSYNSTPPPATDTSFKDIPLEFTKNHTPTSRSFPISNDAYYLIKDNIENEDLQKITPDLGEIDESARKQIYQQVYDWMQKNYGKYRIRKIW
ncbi:MAG: hypothetical protein LBQ31_06210 [Bacteroidales bacterium]|jgi:hypothetical protein|nr:hypothetical protein [Bacteroidales bacterium]